MSIATELQKLRTNMAAAYAECVQKGVECPQSADMATLFSTIREISLLHDDRYSQLDHTHSVTGLTTAIKDWMWDQFGPHIVWEVQDPRTNGIGYSSGKARQLDGSAWKLQNLDLTPYKYILCYVQACYGAESAPVQDQEGQSLCIRVDLDIRSISPRTNMYIGSQLGYAPQDNGVKSGADIVVSQDKTKLAMIYSNFNTTGTTALERDFRLYKVEGFKYDYTPTSSSPVIPVTV